MTKNEALRILHKIQSYDGRTIGEGDVLAWHEAINDLPVEHVMAAIPRWFGNRDYQGQRLMPGHLRAIVEDLGHGRGLTDLQRTTLRHNQAAAIDACTHCDDKGWINGAIDHDDVGTRTTAFRCDHTNKPLPPGFRPD